MAAGLEGQATSERLDVGKSEGTPEKLFEAITGYYEGLHRPPIETPGQPSDSIIAQRRDPQRIVSSQPDRSESDKGELSLIRRRVQRGEWELAAISLKRAREQLGLVDKETVEALNAKVAQIDKELVQGAGRLDLVDSQAINSIGMWLVLIPAGNFRMGSSPSEIRRVRAEWNIAENLVDPESPDHIVEISKPFLIGKYDVTVGQFKKFVTETGYRTVAENQGWGWGYDESQKHWVKKSGLSWKNPGFPVYDDHPVVMVCHVDAEAFCNWLTSREGRKYTLPTEAQFEYAARGGRQGERFSWGNNYPDGRKLNFADSSCDVPWADRFVKDLHGFTSPVGTLRT